jgi:hypothetical protein
LAPEREKGATIMTIPFKGGRPAGLPKTGGRQRGTPNKASLSVEEKLNSIGCDPIIELAKIGMNPKFAPDLRGRMLYGLAEFIHPKRKPADAATAERPEININTNLENSADSVEVRNEREPKPTTQEQSEINVDTKQENGESVEVRDECEPEPDHQVAPGSGIKKA